MIIIKQLQPNTAILVDSTYAIPQTSSFPWCAGASSSENEWRIVIRSHASVRSLRYKFQSKYLNGDQNIKYPVLWSLIITRKKYSSYNLAIQTSGCWMQISFNTTHLANRNDKINERIFYVYCSTSWTLIWINYNSPLNENFYFHRQFYYIIYSPL